MEWPPSHMVFLDRRSFYTCGPLWALGVKQSTFTPFPFPTAKYCPARFQFEHAVDQIGIRANARVSL